MPTPQIPGNRLGTVTRRCSKWARPNPFGAAYRRCRQECLNTREYQAHKENLRRGHARPLFMEKARAVQTNNPRCRNPHAENTAWASNQSTAQDEAASQKKNTTVGIEHRHLRFRVSKGGSEIKTGAAERRIRRQECLKSM